MISVCIATYNGSQYIEEQLYSILPQIRTTTKLLYQTTIPPIIQLN